MGESKLVTKKVLVFGTFDIFHQGHEHFLKEARKYGDFLRVVVARDETVLAVKKRAPKNKENLRKQILEESSLVEEVVLGNLGDKYEIIREYRPDVICLGYDQKFFIEKLQEKLNKFGLKETKIFYLASHQPEIYKSSKLRKLLE